MGGRWRVLADDHAGAGSDGGAGSLRVVPQFEFRMQKPSHSLI